MEMFQSIRQCYKGLGIKDILASNITEFQKGPESLNHLTRDMPFNCRNIDLHMFNTATKGVDSAKITFMRALELSPVHCLNLRPSGNLRKPAKGAAAAILDNKIINTTAD